MNENTKQLIIRLPEVLHTWLKQNIPEGGINEFVVGLIQQHIQNLNPAAKVEIDSPEDNPLEKYENQIVWRNFTRKELLEKFDRNKPLTVMKVAAELGISYKEAYTYIVPWLMNEGFLIKPAKQPKKKKESMIHPIFRPY